MAVFSNFWLVWLPFPGLSLGNLYLSWSIDCMLGCNIPKWGQAHVLYRILNIWQSITLKVSFNHTKDGHCFLIAFPQFSLHFRSLLIQTLRSFSRLLCSNCSKLWLIGLGRKYLISCLCPTFMTLHLQVSLTSKQALEHPVILLDE